MKLAFDVDLGGIPSSYPNFGRDMGLIAKEALERIRKRTLSGLNANNKPFPPGVDMVESGRMLRSMSVSQAGVGGFELSVGVEYAAAMDKKYNWFAFSTQDVAFIMDRIADVMLGEDKARR